jgi:hypothetical protein
MASHIIILNNRTFTHTMTSETRVFCVAEHYFKVFFTDNRINNIGLIRSCMPFMVQESPEPFLAEITVDDNLQPRPKAERQRIRDFEGGNGDTVVDLLPDGGYQFIYKDIEGNECALLISDKGFRHVTCALKGNYDMRCFGLTNTIMLTFAMAASYKQTVMIHASLVRQNGYGYAFCAASGTGKSTQVSMWLRYLPGCDLMNDDNPCIRIIDGQPYIFGTPWSGKTPCYRNTKARLGAMTRIDRAPANSVDKLSPVEGFTSILPSCSNMKWDIDINRNICNTVVKIVETTGAYILHCLPNREAAEVCNAAIAVRA